MTTTITTSAKSHQLNDLIETIENKRKQMISMGLRYGFTNNKTITISQELDKLLNQLLSLDDVLH